MEENFYNLIQKTAKYREAKEKFLNERDETIKNVIYKRIIKGVYNLQSLIDKVEVFLGGKIYYREVLKSVTTDFTNSYYELVFYGGINREVSLQLILTYPKISSKGVTVELRMTSDTKKPHKSIVKFTYNNCYKHIQCLYHEIYDYFKIPKLKAEIEKLNKEVKKLSEELDMLENRYTQNIRNSY